MPSLEVDSFGVPAVTAFAEYFEEALEATTAIKPEATVEPALEESELEDVLERLPAAPETTDAQSTGGLRQRNSSRFATIETAARGLLSNLIARVSIDSPEFVKVWNFFDILQCLSDRGQCDPALLVWLIEELLDSQTIPGCRKIFDYLESRRKRIISKHFSDKKLVILRSCNELLRRLSRAEDTAFSGRVFIFLFQSMPPGDKSSVNLRGEYHIQNVTTYDQDGPKSEPQGDQMDVDSKEGVDHAQSKAVSFSEKRDSALENTLDADALYPIFWSLQESFNQPKKLFDPSHLRQFKSGLQATMTAFKTNPVQHDKKSSKQTEDKRGLKRKHDAEDDDVLAAFNPKYLTSRDLFELEINDLTLRRYVLVQALIVMDFLLSLSSTAKEKLASVQVVNKSVAYLDQVLSEEDIKWATEMKSDVTEYLKLAHDGQFFYRMVETILSRDKNWVRWKIENCPPIERPAVSPQEWANAMDEAKANTTSKRIRPNTMHPLSLDFLKNEDDSKAVEELKDPRRFKLPEVKNFKRGIQEADLEIEMPLTDKSKAEAIETKASMSWRALRIASRGKLRLFDKIESYEDISILFEDENPKEEEADAVEVEDEDEAQQNGGGGGDGDKANGTAAGEGKANATINTDGAASAQTEESAAPPTEQNPSMADAMVTDDT